MTRLISVLTILMVVGLGAPAGWAQWATDPMVWGWDSPGALEGGYRSDLATGTAAWLAVASPRNCNDGTVAGVCDYPVRVYFYDATCTVVDSVSVPLTENDTELLPIFAVSSNPVGNVLVATADPAAPGQPLLNTAGGDAPIIGRLFMVDLNRGIARTEDLARLSVASGNKWTPYAPVAMIPFLPPDDQTSLSVTLTFRCPTGVSLVDPVNNDWLIGTSTSLGGHMLDLGYQDDAATPGDAFAAATATRGSWMICDSCADDTNFASVVQVAVYDLDENLLGVANVPCECFTEQFASSIFAGAATSATYWEMIGFAEHQGSGGDNAMGLFAGSWQIQGAGTVGGVPVNVSWDQRFWRARDTDALFAEHD